MTTVQVLRGARELLSSPSRWTTFALARQAGSQLTVLPTDPRACQWCLMGAIAKASHDLGIHVGVDIFGPERDACDALETTLYEMKRTVGIVAFNDYRATRVEDIQELLDATIERLEAGTKA